MMCHYRRILLVVSCSSFAMEQQPNYFESLATSLYEKFHEMPDQAGRNVSIDSLLAMTIPSSAAHNTTVLYRDALKKVLQKMLTPDMYNELLENSSLHDPTLTVENRKLQLYEEIIKALSIQLENVELSSGDIQSQTEIHALQARYKQTVTCARTATACSLLWLMTTVIVTAYYLTAS